MACETNRRDDDDDDDDHDDHDDGDYDADGVVLFPIIFGWKQQQCSHGFVLVVNKLARHRDSK